MNAPWHPIRPGLRGSQPVAHRACGRRISRRRGRAAHVHWAHRRTDCRADVRQRERGRGFAALTGSTIARLVGASAKIATLGLLIIVHGEAIATREDEDAATALGMNERRTRFAT